MNYTQLVSYLVAVTTVAAFIRNVPCRVRMTQLKISNKELQRYIEEANDLLGSHAETDRLIKVAITLYSKDVEMEMALNKDMEMALNKKDMEKDMALNKKDMKKNKTEAYFLSKIAFLSQR